MNIIIVGCGKVGLTMAEQLRQENHAITLIDTDRERLEAAVGAMDIQGVPATVPATKCRWRQESSRQICLSRLRTTMN